MKLHEMKLLLFAALLAPCVARADAVDWTKYTMSVQVAFSGYSGTTTLENFPVLVRVSDANGFFYSQFKDPAGGDLRFSDAEGNLLASEIDTWNPSGESLVWVKVPLLNASTVITAHYGCTTPDAVTASDVWSNGYLGVWHMGDTQVDGSGNAQILDSTGNGATFVEDGNSCGNNTTGAAGQIGNCVEFGTGEGESNKGKGGMKCNSSTVRRAGTSALTVECWAWQDDHDHSGSGTMTNAFLVRETSNQPWTPIYQLQELGDVNQWQNGKIVARFWDASKSQKTANPDSRPSRAVWNHYAATYGESIGRYLCNGVSLGTCEVGDLFSSENTTLFLGNISTSGTMAWPGKIDEVRISSVARSEDWLKATHDCVAEAGFASYKAILVNDWTKYSHKFTVSFAGYVGGETLTNFPALVKISESSVSGFDYDDCRRRNGGDLRFADAEGNLLASEVDTWDTSGTSLVWVKVPTLNALTKITAYYGNELAPDVDAEDVWANGYLGVWHMGDTKVDGSGNAQIVDSTGNGATFAEDANSRGKNTAGVAGLVGNCVEFGTDSENPTKGGLVCTSSSVLRAGTSAFTFECWARQDDHEHGDSTTTRNAYLVREGEQASPWKEVYWIDEVGDNNYGHNGKIRARFRKTSSSDLGIASSNRPAWKTWNHHAATYNATAGFLFLNGVSTGSVAVDGSLYPTENQTKLYLGNMSTSQSVVWPGKIDEVRISSVARSEDWLKATYDTVKNNATFATYGVAKDNGRKGMVIVVR